MGHRTKETALNTKRKQGRNKLKSTLAVIIAFIKVLWCVL